MSYQDALKIVINWGTDKFTEYVQNAALAKQRKIKLCELAFVCLTCKAPLMEVVKLREDANDMVFAIDSPSQMMACPAPWDDGAADYAKNLLLIHWDPDQGTLRSLKLQTWLDTEEHLLSSLLLLGPGGLGKSKLMHMIAKEMCVAYEKTQYIFGKSIDSLGILSYSGAIRNSGAVCLTDFEFKAARGASYGDEALKSLLDVPEGGSIQGTRYRPAIFPPGVPRVLALNGDAGNWGQWFANNDQGGIAAVLSNLNDMKVATQIMKASTPDDQASCRRVSIGICTQKLITDDTKKQLRSDARAKAAAGLVNRRLRRKADEIST
jgi:hypothetical protein